MTDSSHSYLGQVPNGASREDGASDWEETEALGSGLEAVLVLGSDRRVIAASGSFQELFGVSTEKVEGRSLFEVEDGLFDLPRLRSLMEKAFERRSSGEAAIEGDFGPLGRRKLCFETHLLTAPVPTLLTVQDLTERRRSRKLVAAQRRLLELIASGASREECLSVLCEAVPQLSDGVRASILLADEDRDRFTQNIAPDLDASFGEGLEGAPINDLCIGTCGEAVFSGERVVSTDIASDETWSKEWRELCVAHGIRACFSAPIWDEEGEDPKGSFMLCFEEPREASKWERALADFGTHIARIALEREGSREALREREAQLEADLANYKLLQRASTELLQEESIEALHEKILDVALDIIDADFGSVQKIAPGQDELVLLAHRGFNPEAATFWKQVGVESGSTCSRALDTGERVVVSDVETSEFMFRDRRQKDVSSNRNPCGTDHAPDLAQRRNSRHDFHALDRAARAVGAQPSPHGRLGEAGR